MTREAKGKERHRKRRKRIDMKRWTPTYWLATPVRLVGNKGPLVVGVTKDAKQSVKDAYL